MGENEIIKKLFELVMYGKNIFLYKSHNLSSFQSVKELGIFHIDVLPIAY